MNNSNVKYQRYVSKESKIRFCRVELTVDAQDEKYLNHVFQKDQLCCSESDWDKMQHTVAAYLKDEWWRDFTIS